MCLTVLTMFSLHCVAPAEVLDTDVTNHSVPGQEVKGPSADAASPQNGSQSHGEGCGINAAASDQQNMIGYLQRTLEEARNILADST